VKNRPRIAVLVRRNYWLAPTAGPGNSSSHRAVPDILAAVRQAGGDPTLVFEGSQARPQEFAGLILPGGGDIDPQFYGQSAGPAIDLATLEPEVDQFQLDWAGYALRQDLPLLGICRGMQVLNVAGGGTLLQDVPNHTSDQVLRQPELRSQPFHACHLLAGSRLEELMGVAEMQVNSIHHQAVDRLGRGLQAVAWAPDGLTEALESSSGRQRGVQFHPEDMRAHLHFQRLFQQLVEDAGVSA
jgi:putative glutamine amidotransferase